jgi:hypothetical protein
MDYETLINCFVAVFQHYKEDDDIRVFVVSELRDDREELINFLHENVMKDEWHISFNGLDFDSQITQYLLITSTELLNCSVTEASHKIYIEAQRVIEHKNQERYAPTSEKNLAIKQIDLFKLNHWDNPAKSSSLKWIQYSMDWYNIQEMPIHHSTVIDTQDQLDTIIQYCINDVKSSYQIFLRSKSQIALRLNLSKDYSIYGINLNSASEPRISKELFSLFLAKKIGMTRYDLKNLRTHRDFINVGSILLPYIKFTLPEFKQIHDQFKSLVINTKDTKGGFKYSVTHKGVKTDFGLGGIHGATKPGVYESNDQMIIMTSDVTSFYPNLAIKNKWSPAHLPKNDFCNQYEWFFEERKKIPKKDPKNYVYKIILNSTYGLSNDENSFLYDPEFTMRITINGQLSLSMLYEMLSLGIPESIPLMQNTDGLEMMIPVHMKDRYLEICAEWEKLTSLQLEHDSYKKMIIADVNNYIAVFNDKECSKSDYEKIREENPHYIFTERNGKYFYNASKCKGRFEFHDLALHKNKSFLVIPKGIYNYFVHHMLPEETVSKNKNIFDYCGGAKAKGDWTFREVCYYRGDKFERDLQKITRYYVSTTGCKIHKINKTDGREIQVQAGKWLLTEMSYYHRAQWSDYKVDTQYYIESMYKEINNITGYKPVQQLSLF